jgi:hypothetical protein
VRLIFILSAFITNVSFLTETFEGCHLTQKLLEEGVPSQTALSDHHLYLSKILKNIDKNRYFANRGKNC